MDINPKDFMWTDDLMRDIMSALAHGHADLVDKSRSALGTLAVKSAEMTVSFDFSAQGKETKDGLKLTVRPAPFFGFAADIQTEKTGQRFDVSNRATITLKIVNVAPPPPGDVARPPSENDVMAALAIVLKVVGRIWPMHMRLFEAKVAEIRNLLNSGKDTQAKTIVAGVVQELRSAFKDGNTPMPKELAEALSVLETWNGNVKPKPDPLPSNAKKIIQQWLRGRLNELAIPAEVRENFKKQVEAGLKTRRATAARLLLHRAMADLAPHLAGKTLPKPWLDDLAALELLDALDTGERRWKEQLEPSLGQLRDIVGRLALPARIMADFETACERVLASESAIEAGSRLVDVLDHLRRATEKLELPEGVRETLAQLGPSARTDKTER